MHATSMTAGCADPQTFCMPCWYPGPTQVITNFATTAVSSECGPHGLAVVLPIPVILIDNLQHVLQSAHSHFCHALLLLSERRLHGFIVVLPIPVILLSNQGRTAGEPALVRMPLT